MNHALASIASLSVALQQLVLSKHCQWQVRLQTSQMYMSSKGGEIQVLDGRSKFHSLRT